MGGGLKDGKQPSIEEGSRPLSSGICDLDGEVFLSVPEGVEDEQLSINLWVGGLGFQEKRVGSSARSEKERVRRRIGRSGSEVAFEDALEDFFSRIEFLLMIKGLGQGQKDGRRVLVGRDDSLKKGLGLIVAGHRERGLAGIPEPLGIVEGIRIGEL